MRLGGILSSLPGGGRVETHEDIDEATSAQDLSAGSTLVSEGDAPFAAPTPAPATSAPQRGRWRRWAFALVLLVLLPASLYAARTEMVLGGALDDRLERLRELTGVRVVRSDVSPAGLTGVQLRNVLVRRPDDGGSLWLAVEHLEIYPDVLALMGGRLRLGHVIMDGVETNLVFGEGGDLSLIAAIRDGLSNRARSGRPNPVRRPGQPAPEPRAGVGDVDLSALTRLPSLELRRAHVRFEDRDERLPTVIFDSQSLLVDRHQEGPSSVVTAIGDIDLVGYGPGMVNVALRLPEQTGHIEVRWQDAKALTPLVARHLEDSRLADVDIRATGVAIHWPRQVGLHGVTVQGLDQPLPWDVADAAGDNIGSPRVVGLKAEWLSIARPGGRWEVASRDAVAVTEIPQRGRHVVPLSNARLSLDRAANTLEGNVEFHGALGLGNVTGRWEMDTSAANISAKVADLPLTPYGPLTPHALARHLSVRSGRLSGALVFEHDPTARRMTLHTDLTLAKGHVRSPVLAGDVLRDVDVGAQVDLKAEISAGRVTVERATLRAGALEARLAGDFTQGPEHWSLHVDASVPQTDAQAAISGIPAALIPMLQGYQLDGAFAGRVKISADSRRLDETQLDVELDTENVRVIKAGPLSPIPSLAQDFELQVLALPGDRKIGPGVEGWVNYDDLPSVVPQAITSAEDGGFWKHNGFSMPGIRAALVKNLEAGGLVRGGSTISQQVVKNLFLNHDRTVSRKLQEVLLTWHMEQAVSKERILEIYLNMLHLGPGIYGIRDASRVIFRKMPSRLSLREAVFLGSVLPNPNRFVRLYARRRIPVDRRTKMRNILVNMQSSGFITEVVLERTAVLLEQGVISIADPPSDLPADPG